MEQQTDLDVPWQEASEPYVGRWNRLVSTTNWEKGRIIYEWRQSLLAEQATVSEYSDEAWSRLVGGVSGQHIGRLRRVYERFGDVYQDYAQLFWSHFQSALDWDDAEMWLEGASQNSWSVSRMRRERWQTMGAVRADEPRDDDIVSAELDEDVVAVADDSRTSSKGSSEDGNLVVGAEDYYSEAKSPAGPDFGDDDESSSSPTTLNRDAKPAADRVPSSIAESVRPFENLPELPEDFAEAFEMFKLAILRHKADQWQSISQQDVIASLQSLQQLVLAPTSESV